VILVLVAGYIESRAIEDKSYTVTSADIPREFDGLTIVLLTDIHESWFFSEDRVRDVVARVNSLDPDLVLLGGDYVDRNIADEYTCFSALAELKAPLGVYAVTGNHDYDESDDGTNSAATITAASTEAGIELLDNRGMWLEKDGTRIRLGGVADLQEGDPDVGPALEGTSPEDFVLLLSHHPDFAETLAPDSVDLMLSGHTHGGQITLFGLWAPMVPSDYGQKYRSGEVTNGSTTVIVSNGVGSTVLPVRLFARPQLVIITLESSSRSE
jgi:uncharacterized protein